MNDKKDKVNEVISKIQDEHGEGSIMNLGEEKHLDIDTISSGSLSLDHALGVGGIPRGKVVEIFGKEASGKCLAKDTYINTENGLETIEEFFERNNVVPSCTSKITDGESSVVNRNGNLEEVGEFVNNNRRQTFKVKTESGNEIKCTPNHPFLVMSKDGYWVWKNAIDLTTDDYVIQRRDGNFGGKAIRDKKSYFLGTLIADAYFGEQRVGVTNDDPYIKNIIVEEGIEIFGVEPKKYNNNDNGSINYHFNCKEFVQDFYQEFGYQPGKAKDKYFSQKLRGLDKESTKALIQGYMDSESYVGQEESTISVTSASHELLLQLKLLLQQFGIIATLKDKKVKAYPDNDYYRLSISGKESLKYKRTIGSKSPKIKKSMKNISKPSQTYDNIPHLDKIIGNLKRASETTREHQRLIGDYYNNPNSNPIPYKKLDEIFNLEWKDSLLLDRLKEVYETNYYYDKVKSIQEYDNIPTFDLHLPETHSFITNGLITHNTTLALHIIAEAQKEGGLAAFIDAEHALDPKYSRAIGVDLDDIFLSQPSSGEQALEITEKLVRSSTMDVVVIDSVAALVPQAELEGEMGDSQIGLQARLMSQAMRKLTSAIAQSKTMVVFINQIRSKINNSPWGPSTTTSGGRALKFYSSLRLNIYISKTIDNSAEEKVGNETTVRVVKNKVSPPFKEAKFDIIYGEGISRERELLELGQKYDVVERSGAWYSYDDDNLGQGKANSVECLKESKDIREEIEKRIKNEME